MKKPLIPFGWLPGHWGLKGTTREIARAEYELDGVELEIRLAEIRNKDQKERERETLSILLKHEKISTEDYDRRINDLIDFDDETKKSISSLDLDLKHGKITQEKYDRKKADILKEPWVSMPRIHWDPLGKSRTYFELDYNEHFVAHLRENGYVGDEDEDIINAWLNDICISISEEISGMEMGFNTPSRRSPDSE